MECMTIEEIIKAVGGKMTDGKAIFEKEVGAVCTDTRKIEPGCIFMAIKGEKFDGHDFVKDAIEKGAVAAITEAQIGKFPCISVSSTRKALLDLARAYRLKFKLHLVGVTGSVGKTTTKEMVYLALSSKYKTLKTEGNLNNEIGLPQNLFKLDSSYEAAVLEMGMSHFGEIHRLSSAAQPTAGIITNIGFSHIENLGSREGILKAKLEILDGMNPSAPLIINADDDMLSALTLDRETITFGIENKHSEVRAENINFSETSSFDIIYKGIAYPAVLNCIGKHNVLNALAAFAAGVVCGAEPEEIIKKLSEYSPIGMRQKIEKRGQQTLIIDCYNASPDSMKASLSVLSKLTPENGGRRVAVLADMLELGDMAPKLHEKVGEMAVEAGVEKLICYGENAKYIAAKADELGLHSGSTTDKGMLIEYLKASLKPGDIVLFKGSRGMKLEEVINELYGQESF